MTRYIALIPAAGSGARFGSETPKQYLPLVGKPMIHHALAALCRCQRIETVWVVLSPTDEWWESFDWSEFAPKLHVLRCGGATRAETVSNGLAAMDASLDADDWVLVHDAARPCLAQSMLDALCTELCDDPVGGLLAVPVADTVKRADGRQRVTATLSRDALWQAQTPQMFRYAMLCRALQASSAVTDEAGAIEAAGLQPRLVRADVTNLKVTFAADLSLAELILQGRSA